MHLCSKLKVTFKADKEPFPGMFILVMRRRHNSVAQKPRVSPWRTELQLPEPKKFMWQCTAHKTMMTVF